MTGFRPGTAPACLLTMITDQVGNSMAAAAADVRAFFSPMPVEKTPMNHDDALRQLSHIARERAFGKHVGSDRLVQAGLNALIAQGREPLPRGPGEVAAAQALPEVPRRGPAGRVGRGAPAHRPGEAAEDHRLRRLSAAAACVRGGLGPIGADPAGGHGHVGAFPRSPRQALATPTSQVRVPWPVGGVGRISVGPLNPSLTVNPANSCQLVGIRGIRAHPGRGPSRRLRQASSGRRPLSSRVRVRITPRT